MNKFILLILMIIAYTVSYMENIYTQNINKQISIRPVSSPSASLVDINNITSWVGAAGFHDGYISGWWNGMFPKGSNIGAIYTEGIVWGGKVNDGQLPLVRVNGNTYYTGCQSDLPYRVFRVRPDYQTGNLADDAANFYDMTLDQVDQTEIDALRDQYETDWNEWPADKGAPYDDVNNDGKYEPETDIPGIPGVDQTLYIQYTDAFSEANYGSQPIGLNISETYWAYAYTGALGNVIYKKVEMIYKGTANSAANSTIDSMYIVQWADPDVGTSSDDFAGCDTALNLGYTYNAQDQDSIYQAAGYGTPAVGYEFLQGVSLCTGNPNDSAIVNLQWRKGYRYANPKPMSSLIYYTPRGNWLDPTFDYTGTLEFYNMMRGNKPEPHFPSAEVFPEAVADVTRYGTYLLAGDPSKSVSATNKIDGNTAAGGDSPGDRRIMVINGPFNMNLDDTAEVVIALVAAEGTENLSSITNLKLNSVEADTLFIGLVNRLTTESLYLKKSKLNKYILYQNYPNPFNPNTKIIYSIPNTNLITLKVYDVLGREVATLLNEVKPAGNYEIIFDGSSLSSGIYFYRMQAGNYIKTRKMILLK